MQATFKQTGDTITLPIAAAVACGDVKVIGRVVGVVVRDVSTAEVALGREAEVQVRGVFTMPLVGSLAITQGDALYWDADGNPYGGTAGSGCITKTATDVFCGYAAAGAASNAGSVAVLLAAKDGVDLT